MAFYDYNLQQVLKTLDFAVYLRKSSKDNEDKQMRSLEGQEDDFFGSGGPPVALMINRNKLPPEIGTRFDAHGIAKGSVQQQLDTLNTLLTKGINPEKPFHTMQLSVAKEDQAGVPAMGAANVYDTGQFIVLGKPDKLIKDEGISAVLVNKPFYEAVEFLQNTFPTVKFIKANEMQDGLRGMI